jgi:hypothetical protein
MQMVVIALKRGATGFPRYIAVRELSGISRFHLYMREFGAKNPTRGTGMQFAPL